jgi:hypothetical protein
MTWTLDDVRCCCLDQSYPLQLYLPSIVFVRPSLLVMEAYIRQQHEWLGRLYPAISNADETSPTQPTLDPQSPRRHIIQTFRDVLESECQSRDAAESLANIIQGTEILYHNMWGSFFSAVEHFSDIKMLSSLSDLLACLASHPGSINTPRNTIPDDSLQQLTNRTDKLTRVNDEKELFWRDLPHFSLYLTERMQGPEAYLSRGESDETASRTWSNINTLVALLVRDHSTTFQTLFSTRVEYAFRSLAFTLEHPPKSRWGKNMAIHMPAACRWILLASDAVWEALNAGCEGNPWMVVPGQLWRNQDGGREVDGRRWAFWKFRFEVLREDLRLDDEMADIALQTSRLM